MPTPELLHDVAAWLSARYASAKLGISPKTVWRWASAGKLLARKVAGAHGGLVWEIAGDASGHPIAQSDIGTDTDRPDKRTSERTSDSPTDRLKAEFKRERNGQPTDQADIGTATDLTAHLLGEVAFLRAALEQRDRDAAELRAALRAALKLTAGTSAPQLEAGTPEPPEREQSGAANRVPSVSPATPEQPARRDGAAITYDSIADMIERSMGK